MHIQRFEEYLKTFANYTTIERGKKIFDRNRYLLKNFVSQGMGEADYGIMSDADSSHFYRVKVTGFASENSILLTSCSCFYNLGGICKHRVAAILALDSKLQFEPIVKKFHDMESSIYLGSDLSDFFLHKNTSPAFLKLAPKAESVKIIEALNGIAVLEVTFKNNVYHVILEKINELEIKTSCSCAQSIPVPLCEHKVAAIETLRKEYGVQAFDQLKDWTDDKNALLAEYGFSLEDNISDKFQFEINKSGKLNLIKLDTSIQKLSNYQNWPSITNRIFLPDTELVSDTQKEDNNYEQILVYTLKKEKKGSIPEISIDILSTKLNNKTGKFTKIESLGSRFHSTLPTILPSDAKAIGLIQRIQEDGIRKYAKQQRLIENIYFETIIDKMPPKVLAEIQSYIGNGLDELANLLQDKKIYLAENNYNTLNEMTPIEISKETVRPQFILKEDDSFLILEIYIEIENENLALSVFEYFGYWLIMKDNIIYKLDSLNSASLVHYFSSLHQIKVKKTNLEGFFKDFIIPLSEKARIELNISAELAHKYLSFKETRLFLKEDDSNLIIQPAFIYPNETNPEEEHVFSADGGSQKVSLEDSQIVILKRNRNLENEKLKFLESLHPSFVERKNKNYFTLPFQEVMENSWLFEFFEKTKEAKIAVYGFKELKKLKFNPNRPTMNIRNSSGIDWFDMSIEISFGDQFVSLSEIKKAIVKKQNYVELGDGTLGMLPNEWINKYATLFKMGSIHKDTLKLSKLHFNIIDELIDEVDDHEIWRELQEKKQKLLHFKEIKNVAFPENVKAELRDYQMEGYKWLNFLDEFQWGGCLADDMGLGKTLQILTFLQEQKNRKKHTTNLIVLPTTLIFNWQAEADKFTPDLKYYIHKGIGRSKNLDFFTDYNLILTTYGTVRSDIDKLKDFEFDYIILDESQAVKNPDSLISKAVRLLKAKNRLVMTGTPVENNTFDLYSQMEFLNPGFLGSKEYFKDEFANPIDKFQDKDVALKLRNLLKPFLLKRTKEEVAKDLPEKTETILYCEMAANQRKVYDTFREMYRQKIVDKMAVDGKDKSSFLILEGLLKLRQICDSPALLSDDTDYGDDSVKLEEILREIEENASNHKIVIFSQFLKMLDLIRQNLEKHKISYEYLDGQTTDRAERVNHFQNNENCRVFLMSLKAGGVGINLTEADYVYLVDPWWNPAVEQQAIDRTHRIGQTKNVFAYRMICKDTIEEKILMLQARKKDIANDLISTETGFIKKLTRDDIVELFS
jgi:SNF2 family DNA or RNA helicase